MFSRILLPQDGSPLAEQALPRAAALDERFQAELILLKVLVLLASNLNLPPGAVKKAKIATRELARDYLKRIASARLQDTDLPITAVTLDGRPHKEIIRFAETEQVDLIVMCTRGFSGISRWLKGSVSDRVVRGTSKPVLLIRPPEKNHDR